MEITIDVKDDDIVEAVHLDCSPVEYLIINKALKEARNNKDWHKTDREVVKEMLEDMRG